MNRKMLLIAAGAVVAGGAIGYAIAHTRAARKALDTASKTIGDTGLRLPEPGYAMVLPESDDDFATLDEVICECGSGIVSAADPEDFVDDIVGEIRDCVAERLYPDFPWPPMTGDHPTTAKLYAELEVLARKALATATICPEAPVQTGPTTW